MLNRKTKLSETYIGMGVQYEHFTPLEVAYLSRDRVAMGYDILRWGESTENSYDATPIALATPIAVKFDRWSSEDANFVYSDCEKVGATPSIRSKYISAKVWVPWKDLSTTDRDFALSLVWVPADPMTPLEALASNG